MAVSPPVRRRRGLKHMETFCVERADHGYYTVSSGDRYQDKLDQGEALYLLACLLLGKGEPTLLLKTKEEHAAQKAALAVGSREPNREV